MPKRKLGSSFIHQKKRKKIAESRGLKYQKVRQTANLTEEHLKLKVTAVLLRHTMMVVPQKYDIVVVVLMKLTVTKRVQLDEMQSHKKIGNTSHILF